LTFDVLYGAVLSNGRQPSKGFLPGWFGDCTALPVGAVSEINSLSIYLKGPRHSILPCKW